MILRNFLYRIREKLYLLLWDKKTPIMSFLKISGFLVSLISVISIVVYYGFKHSTESDKLFYNILYFSFSFYVVKYLISLILSFQIKSYLKKTWFEALVLFTWVLNVILALIFNFNLLQIIIEYLGMPLLLDYSIVLIQLFFFVVVGVEMSKVGDFFTKLNIGTSGLMLLSFIILITTGALLLLMPEMTTHGISIIDSFFTSTSACCVTGLASVDTATAFTFKGKIVIMMLIQFGGINIISFAAFFAFFSGDKSGLKHTTFMKKLT